MTHDTYDWLEIEEMTKEEFDKMIHILLLDDHAFKVSSLSYGCLLQNGRIVELPINRDHGSADEFYKNHKDDIFKLLVSHVKVKFRRNLERNFTKYSKKSHKALSEVFADVKNRGGDPWQ